MPAPMPAMPAPIIGAAPVWTMSSVSTGVPVPASYVPPSDVPVASLLTPSSVSVPPSAPPPSTSLVSVVVPPFELPSVTLPPPFALVLLSLLLPLSPEVRLPVLVGVCALPFWLASALSFDVLEPPLGFVVLPPPLFLLSLPVVLPPPWLPLPVLSLW